MRCCCATRPGTSTTRAVGSIPTTTSRLRQHTRSRPSGVPAHGQRLSSHILAKLFTYTYSR
jgi:hypothetical protein